MVTRARFQSLAERLQTKYADFFISRTFKTPGGYDPTADEITEGSTENVGAVREEYDARQVDGDKIQTLDFKLLALVADFETINPRTDGPEVNVDGTQCQVIRAEKDAADAVWVMQVRAL